MFNRIPQDLRGYHQWVCWKYEERQGDKLTKVPFDPKTGLPASVDNPAQWSTFEQVCNAYSRGGYDGIGFVLTEHDPFTFIDLDYTKDQLVLEQQIKLYNRFNSYSERSPSGQGCHIIVKGHVPSGRRRSSIEVYSSLRYMTMTGDVVNNVPIAERQDMLAVLWQEMGRDRKGNNVAYDMPQIVDDQTIINRSCAAANGPKFEALLRGQWQQYYNSQSEADFSFIDMVQFYTQNQEQIARIFRISGLGQRPKALRHDYVNSMIVRAFDRTSPPLNFELLAHNMQRFLSGGTPATPLDAAGAPSGLTSGEPVSPFAATTEPLSPHMDAVNPYTVPDGLLGQIANFIYSAAPRPVPEAALVGAIGLMAGICGRAYNTPTGAGLNMYTLLLAQSGTGKEQIAEGIAKLVTGVATLIPSKPGENLSVPSIHEFIGPSEIRSDAALLKTMSRQPSIVSVIGEWGLKMKAMCDIHASSHMAGLKSVYLDLYGKSGKGNMLGQTVYSDKEKNTLSLASPSFSIIGESTPQAYYPNITEDLIAQGLLPRFLVVEYYGKRVPSNKRRVAAPDKELCTTLAALAKQCHSLNAEGNTITVDFEASASQMSEQYDVLCDDKINASQNIAVRDLWNRAHIKTMKLACLVAIGINQQYPVVSGHVWKWAELIVTTDVMNMLGRFERGETGRDSEENKQTQRVLQVIYEYIRQPWDQIKKYDNGAYKMHQAHVVPYRYIQHRCVANAVFKNDRIGATNAIKRALVTLCDSGDLAEVDKRQMYDAYGIQQKAYVLNVRE